MMVPATVEAGGAVVAVMVAAFVTVAMTMVAVVVPVMVVMPGHVLVPLRRGRSGEQHEVGDRPATRSFI